MSNMEHPPQDNKPNEPPHPQPDRPALRTDLSGSESSPTTLIATAQALLHGEELETFTREIQDAGTPETDSDYSGLLEIIDRHVELVDMSDVYPRYAWQGRITAAVQWLNEQIKTLPQDLPCNTGGLYPDFDDPAIGPEAYLNVLWDEVAQSEQLMDQCDGSQREHLEHYHDFLMTTIVKFWRYGLL